VGTKGSVEVVKALPFAQRGLEIDIAFIAKQLIKVLNLRPM
jgi:hypothetical protein